MPRSERAWVAQLSCGHVVGSVPPSERDVPPPEDSVVAAQRRAMGGTSPARAAKPPEPAFIEAPEIEQAWWCHPCGEGRFVVGLVENRDEPLPRLDARRDGTRW